MFWCRGVAFNNLKGLKLMPDFESGLLAKKDNLLQMYKVQRLFDK